ncbi:hypothetical protein ABEB36_002234 [Hypothenemus hampei]|uniref:CCR4-NOT transcription complex subunit 10 n=1 Tax=Hypothenemus hampei TaxID=57062 RepID=A0ABD1F519_HYPHA
MAEKDQDKDLELVSDADKQLAITALNEFRRRNYTACLQTITKLENSRPKDFKVLHNKAIVEYYKSDLRKTDQFKNNLTSICNQFKIKVDKLEEIDYCIAQFNQVVILFHRKEYTAAQAIMDRVYKFIEPMEESLAKQVGLLAIELQLVFKRPDKALTLINYLENNLMYGSCIPLKGLEKNSKEKKPLPLPKPKPISDIFQKKLLIFKLRCYLMGHSLSIVHKELALILSDQLKVDLAILAANLEYLKGNFIGALKCLSVVTPDILGFYEYGESSNVMYNNNMGVVYHAMGKPNLACHYFQKAIKEDISIWQDIKKKDGHDVQLFVRGGCKPHELLYNLGVALLYAGRPAEAFDCLIFVVRRYHRNSRLWLRITECCIAVHKKSNETDFDLQKKQKELIQDVVGSGLNRKVILTSSLSKDKKYNVESNVSYAIPVPTLEFATFCLRNAKSLLPVSSSEVPPEPLFLVPGVTPPAPPPTPTLAPSNPSSLEEIQILKNTILAANAYVSLCLGDYLTALTCSKELLAQEKISSVHKLLGHLYAAECLILIDDIPEAMKHLDPQQIKDIDFHFPREETGEEARIKTNPPPKWFPNNLATVHAVMQYNLAVAKTMRGQLDQAGEILKQIWQQRSSTYQVPAHIIMLVIYIELQLGHAEIARKLLRQYSMQQRFSG